MKVLVTGAAGYIGSCVSLACLDSDSDIEVVGVDDLSSAHARFPDGLTSYTGDISDGELLDRIMREHPAIEVVIHCAARIVVPESTTDPLAYYDANVAKSIRMLQHLVRDGVTRVVFSSSAAVYRTERGEGVDESTPLDPRSPYASTKAIVERILEDAAIAGNLRAIALRYFNPIGADPRLRTGLRNPAPTHVLGRIMGAARDGEPFTIMGTDWPTVDGSGLRDFIHVWDLALAHVRALQLFDDLVPPDRPFLALNVGRGEGVTVRQLVSAFERVTGAPLRVREGPRRPGDSAGGFALVGDSQRLLGWSPARSIEDGIRDALSFAGRAQAPE